MEMYEVNAPFEVSPQDPLSNSYSSNHPNANFSDDILALLKTVFNPVSDAIIITDLSLKVIYCNPVISKFVHLSLSDPDYSDLTHHLRFIQASSTNQLSLEQLILNFLSLENESIENQQAFLVVPDHDLLTIEYTISRLCDLENHLIGIVLVLRRSNFSPIRDLFSNNRPVVYDYLTGLVNHYAFEQRLGQAIETAQTFVENHVLCYLDLDHFKIINEACGYGAGDDFLHQISSILKKCIRKSDLLARLGGDEFGLILYHCNVEQALTITNVLRDAVRNFRFSWQEKVFSCSLSVGLVEINSKSEASFSLLNSAISACQKAKNNGRNRSYFYISTDQEALIQRGAIEWLPRILNALEQDQFLFYVQPIIALGSEQTGKSALVSYEVLIRMLDSSDKIILPGEFIPIAEHYGLMHLIDRWVIRNLLAWLSHQSQSNQASFQSDTFLYTVNLSGASLNDDQFLEFVQEQFNLHQIPPHQICFEITETLAISNFNTASHLIQNLKMMGCRFALDDFGSGMSSFGYLKYLPVDYIKIDGMFVKDMASCQVAHEIVESINRIAHMMGIQTIAEFVENDSILSKLKTLGVDYGQGFGIARPAPLKSAICIS